MSEGEVGLQSDCRLGPLRSLKSQVAAVVGYDLHEPPTVAA